MVPLSSPDLGEWQDCQDLESQAVVRAGYRGLLEDIAEGEQQLGESENERLMGFMGNANSLFEQVIKSYHCDGTRKYD